MIGERVNNYEIVSVLGEGGMGAVYLAQHPFMGRKAAIKVLRRELAEDRGLVERFMNEARAANAIHHPNIIDIIDVGQLPSGIPYLMMELLEGESLARRIERQGRLPIGAAVDVAIQTASALHAAHAKGIVHRDLKPDNLFLVPDPGPSRPFGIKVKVLDFGIAKLRGELSGSSAKTQTGSVMGTPPYMSPEQCRGISDEIDHRTDVYALGIILYEMLVGRPPFVSTGWGEVVLMHVTKPPPPPRERNPDVSPELEAVILKALAKDPNDRFSDMADLSVALQAVNEPSDRSEVAWGAAAGGGAVGARPTTLKSAAGEVTPPSGIRDVTLVPRRRGALVAGALALVGAGALAAVVLRARGTVEVGRVMPPAPGAITAPGTDRSAVAPPPMKAVDSLVAPAPAANGALGHSRSAVAVRLRTQPAGVLVTDVASGIVLGTTPLERRIDVDQPIGVRLSKEGYEPATLEIPPGADFDRAVALEPVKAPRTHRHRDTAGPARRESAPLAVGGASASAPAVESKSGPAPSVAAPASTAPVRPRSAAEKW